MAGDLLAGQAISAGEQIVAVARKEIISLAEHYLEAVAFQIEVANDLWVEQADGVARGRVAEAGQEFVRDRRTTDRVGRLEDGNLQPLRCEIVSAGQAVVARADDYNVVHQIPTGVRQSL